MLTPLSLRSSLGGGDCLVWRSLLVGSGFCSFVWVQGGLRVAGFGVVAWVRVWLFQRGQMWLLLWVFDTSGSSGLRWIGAWLSVGGMGTRWWRTGEAGCGLDGSDGSYLGVEGGCEFGRRRGAEGWKSGRRLWRCGL